MNLKNLADNMGMLMGALAAALLLGALGVEYIGRYAPCFMCMMQRYPLYAAVVTGLAGGVWARNKSPAVRQAIVTVTILLVALSGAAAIYHTGEELHWWSGPTACEAPRVIIGAPLDPNAMRITPCDRPAFLIWGLSLANYNAIISLGSAILAALAVRLSKNKSGKTA